MRMRSVIAHFATPITEISFWKVTEQCISWSQQDVHCDLVVGGPLHAFGR